MANGEKGEKYWSSDKRENFERLPGTVREEVVKAAAKIQDKHPFLTKPLEKICEEITKENGTTLHNAFTDARRAEEPHGGGKGGSSDKHQRFLPQNHDFDCTIPSAEATINELDSGLTGMSGATKPGASTIGRPNGNRIR